MNVTGYVNIYIIVTYMDMYNPLVGSLIINMSVSGGRLLNYTVWDDLVLLIPMFTSSCRT